MSTGLSISKNIYSILSGDTQLSGTTIYPIVAPEEVKYPYLVYKRISIEPLYAKNMKIWTQQANGMLQFMVWQVLAENNIGASLQHYKELIEKDLGSMYDIPKNWELVAQMPFGSIEKEPAEKTFLPLEGRIRVFK